MRQMGMAKTGVGVDELREDRMREDDSAYFDRRALQEQVAAQKAACEAARRRHDELAIMYRFRAAMLAKAPPAWANNVQLELA